MFRHKFSRLYELRDCLDNPDSLNSCLRNLEADLNNPDAIKEWKLIEYALKQLDTIAWKDIKNRAAQYLSKWEETSGRGRTQLLNTLNEAWGYNYLKKIGCLEICFIPTSRIKGVETPDLKATFKSTTVICEVKTINSSDEEVLNRKCGSYLFDDESFTLNQGFFKKLNHDIIKARKQCEAYDTCSNARYIVYIVLNFDDFWGEYTSGYFQQIDQFLSKSPVDDIEIIFHKKSAVFSQTPVMKYAKVFDESNGL